MPFEFDGRKYANASSHQKEWGARLIAELGLRGDERILDLGCGDGSLTAKLADLVPHGSVLGIDASEGMIDTAVKHERANLKFARQDINDLPFASEFDLVFSNATLHWIKDHRRLLANVHRGLRDNGVLRFNFAGEGNCSHFNTIIQAVMVLPEYAVHFDAFDWPWYMPGVAEYEALLRQFPFAEAKVWGENADRHFPNTEAIIRWVDQPSIVPFLTRVPDQHRSQFRDTVVERVVRETLQPDGTCFETFRRINVFARKQAASG